jgi:hypothetical protein
MTCWRLIKTLQDDKNEIFRAAHDAHRAADLLFALEHCKSMDQALAHITNSQSSLEHQTTNGEAQIIPSTAGRENPSMEMDF